jgi:hypothetical protein
MFVRQARSAFICSSANVLVCGVGTSSQAVEWLLVEHRLAAFFEREVVNEYWFVYIYRMLICSGAARQFTNPM